MALFPWSLYHPHGKRMSKKSLQMSSLLRKGKCESSWNHGKSLLWFVSLERSSLRNWGVGTVTAKRSGRGFQAEGTMCAKLTKVGTKVSLLGGAARNPREGESNMTLAVSSKIWSYLKVLGSRTTQRRQRCDEKGMFLIQDLNNMFWEDSKWLTWLSVLSHTMLMPLSDYSLHYSSQIYWRGCCTYQNIFLGWWQGLLNSAVPLAQSL